MPHEDVLVASQTGRLQQDISRHRINVKRPIIWAAAIILPWAAIVSVARVIVAAFG
jgi:hypothetical protein